MELSLVGAEHDLYDTDQAIRAAAAAEAGMSRALGPRPPYAAGNAALAWIADRRLLGPGAAWPGWPGQPRG